KFLSFFDKHDILYLPTRRSSDLAGFVFYLFGDGTDDNWSLNVSGSNSIVLPAGTYEVYENIYWTASTFELAAGGEVHLTVLHPRSEEHTSELQSREKIACSLLLE